MDSEKKQKIGKSERASFSGRLGYVLAVAGSAVGLGNIWRFPYLEPSSAAECFCWYTWFSC